MINLLKSLLESIDQEDVSLNSIDPQEKSNDAETDDMLYKEAYEKASITLKVCYDSYERQFKEIADIVRYEAEKNITLSQDHNIQMRSISICPKIALNTLNVLSKLDEILNNKNFTKSNEAINALDTEFMESLNGDPTNKEIYLGKIVNVTINKELVRSNIGEINNNIRNLMDEFYEVYETISNKLIDTKDPLRLEIYAKAFDYCAKIIAREVSALYYAFLELMQIVNRIDKTQVITESSNEESARQYLDELDNLVDEIRAFYDKFEYKEIITPRKKKEPKMYEYVLGALDRRYTLKIPIYKVEGASNEVKDIVENKFISKLESITKKYPNFVILSPNWDDDSDMFIYITLREPFGDKEDRKNREVQTQNESVSLNEAALSKEDRDNLESHEFGIPENRTYPLNDETRIRKAIQFFGYCDPKNKQTLADNIVRRIIELDLVGVISISEKHPNKKFFPEWLLDTCKPELVKEGKKWTIYVNNEKVDYGTLDIPDSSDNGVRVVVVTETGKLF